MPTNLNFNDAGEQRSFDVIPAGTIVTLQMTIRPGGAGDDGWLKRAADGNSEALDCEFTVVDPAEFAKRKVWALLTLAGTTSGHAEAARISRGLLCAILESARGIRPDDKSEAAQAARDAGDWNTFQNLRFVARLGVRPAQAQYPAKNIILEAITPDRKAWTQPVQLPPDPTAPKQPAGNGAAGPTTAPAGAAATSNASISRPKWATD
jgi:hypothetical protein